VDVEVAEESSLRGDLVGTRLAIQQGRGTRPPARSVVTAAPTQRAVAADAQEEKKEKCRPDPLHP